MVSRRSETSAVVAVTPGLMMTQQFPIHEQWCGSRRLFKVSEASGGICLLTVVEGAACNVRNGERHDVGKPCGVVRTDRNSASGWPVGSAFVQVCRLSPHLCAHRACRAPLDTGLVLFGSFAVKATIKII